MKHIFLFCLVFLACVSCSQESSQETSDKPKPVVAISPADNSKEYESPEYSENIDKDGVIIIPVSPDGSSSDSEDSGNVLIKKPVREGSETLGISRLESLKFSSKDLETRVWLFTDYAMWMYKDLAVRQSVFILRRKDGSWSGTIIRDTIKFVDGNKEIEKIIRTELEEPEIGWEECWNQFKDLGILSLPHDANASNIDGPLLVGENKIGEKYEIKRLNENKKGKEILTLIEEKFGDQ